MPVGKSSFSGNIPSLKRFHGYKYFLAHKLKWSLYHPYIQNFERSFQHVVFCITNKGICVGGHLEGMMITKITRECSESEKLHENPKFCHLFKKTSPFPHKLKSLLFKISGPNQNSSVFYNHLQNTCLEQDGSTECCLISHSLQVYRHPFLHDLSCIHPFLHFSTLPLTAPKCYLHFSTASFPSAMARTHPPSYRNKSS